MLPTYSLGDFELTILSDGAYYLDGGAFFGIIPKPLWEKKMPADERNRLATLASLSGARLGTVRAFNESQEQATTALITTRTNR